MSLVLFLALVRLFFSSVFFGFEALRGFRACLVGVLHFLRFPIFSYLALRTSMGPGRSSILRIGSNPTEAFSSRRTGEESDILVVVVHRAAPGEPHFPLDKGKGKINEIQFPNGFEYLRATIQNVEVVGLSLVEPLYGEIFAARYGPPLRIQVWCPDVLTTYVVQVSKMVCFLRWRLRMASISLCILLEKRSCNISMSALLSFPPTSEVFWWGC